jgi:hypothetical protein
VLLYLMNDVLLQGRKKGDDFVAAFRPVMAETVGLVYSNADAKGRAATERLLNIWAERGLYAPEVLRNLRSQLKNHGRVRQILRIEGACGEAGNGLLTDDHVAVFAHGSSSNNNNKRATTRQASHRRRHLPRALGRHRHPSHRVFWPKETNPRKRWR